MIETTSFKTHVIKRRFSVLLETEVYDRTDFRYIGFLLCKIERSKTFFH